MQGHESSAGWEKDQLRDGKHDCVFMCSGIITDGMWKILALKNFMLHNNCYTTTSNNVRFRFYFSSRAHISVFGQCQICTYWQLCIMKFLMKASSKFGLKSKWKKHNCSLCVPCYDVNDYYFLKSKLQISVFKQADNHLILLIKWGELTTHH